MKHQPIHRDQHRKLTICPWSGSHPSPTSSTPRRRSVPRSSGPASNCRTVPPSGPRTRCSTPAGPPRRCRSGACSPISRRGGTRSWGRRRADRALRTCRERRWVEEIMAVSTSLCVSVCVKNPRSVRECNDRGSPLNSRAKLSPSLGRTHHLACVTAVIDMSGSTLHSMCR